MMAEIEERRKRKSNRRSSILKLPRSPRSALSDVDQNVESEEENTVRRKSRRVSFAETYQVKEFHKDNGNGNYNSGKEQTADPPQMLGSNACAGNKVSTAGLATLLTGAIENEMPLSLHKQTRVGSICAVEQKIDAKDFLSSLTSNSQPSSSHFQKIDPPIIPERRHSPLKESSSNMFQNFNKMPVSSMEHTKIFGNEDDQLEMTGVYGEGITSVNKSYSNVTWANESTKVFGKSAIEQYKNEQQAKLNVTSSSGEVMPQAGCRNNSNVTLIERPDHQNETVVGNKTKYFQTEDDEMELTGMNHDFSMMQKQDMSILACSDDLHMVSGNNKLLSQEEKINSKMFLAGLLSGGVSKQNADMVVCRTEDTVDITEKVDGKSFLKGLMGQTELPTQDGRAGEINSLKNKTALLSESMDLTTCIAESPTISDKCQNTQTVASKIDSKEFLSNLMGQSKESQIMEAPQGKVDTQMFLKNFMAEPNIEKPADTTERNRIFDSAEENVKSEMQFDANLFLRNIVQEKTDDNRDCCDGPESSETLRPDDSNFRKERKGLSDITHTYSGPEEIEDNHTIYFNQNNQLNNDDGCLENTECIGGILNSTVNNVTKSGNKTVCFNLEHTVHLVDKVVDSDQEHLEEVIAEAQTREQNKTVHFANDSCLMEETACTGQLMAEAEAKVIGQNKTVYFTSDSCLMEETACTGQLVSQADAIQKEQNQTQHFANESCLMEETACTGKLVAEMEAEQNKTHHIAEESCVMEEAVSSDKSISKAEAAQKNQADNTQHFANESCFMEETGCTGRFITGANILGNEQNKTLHFANKSCFMEETTCVGKLLGSGQLTTDNENIIGGGCVEGIGTLGNQNKDKVIDHKTTPSPGALAVVQKEKLEDASSLPSMSGNISGIGSDINKTVLFEESPMEETCMTGILRQKINNLNQVSVEAKTGVKNQQESIYIQQGTKEKESFEKTKIFSDMNQTSGGFAMEETVCVGGLVRDQNQVSDIETEHYEKEPSNIEKQDPSEKATIFTELNKTGAVAMNETLFESTQSEKVSTEMRKIIPEAGQATGGGPIEETVCVGGLMEGEKHIQEEVTNNSVGIGIHNMETVANKMEEFVCNNDPDIDDNLDNEHLQQKPNKTERTLLFGAMNKTAGLLDETSCIGGIMSAVQLNTNMEELPFEVPGGVVQNKTIIYSNMDKTAVGLMEETECIGKLMVTSLPLPAEKVISENTCKEDDVHEHMLGTGGAVQQTKDVHLQENQDLTSTIEREIEFVSQDSSISKDDLYTTKERVSDCNNQMDNINSPTYPQSPGISMQALSGQDNSKAAAKPLMKLKKRLQRISMGPAIHAADDTCHQIEAMDQKLDSAVEEDMLAQTKTGEKEVIKESVTALICSDTGSVVGETQERERHCSSASTRTQEGIMGEDLPELECTVFKADDSQELQNSLTCDLTCNTDKKEDAGVTSSNKREAGDSTSDLPTKKVRADLPHEEEEFNKAGVSLNMTSASSVSTRSFMGNLSTLLPKPSKANLSAASVREEYNLSRLNVESIDDYLRCFNVIFLDKSRRLSTLAPVSVCPAHTVSEALQLVVYEPQIQAYEWTCEQLTNLIDNCQKLTAESEAKLLKNVPDILKNEPGHQETVDILGEMKSQCRKQAILNFKQCKAKMLKSISQSLKNETEDLEKGLQEISEAELQIDSTLQYLDQAEAELDAEMRDLSSASHVMNEIKDAEEKKRALDSRCRSLEKERTELSVANDKLRAVICELRKKSEEVNADIERLGSRRQESQHAKLMNLKSISAFEVLSWDDNTGGQLSFLEGSLLLHVVLGKALSHKWHDDTPHREVTEIQLKASHKLGDTYGSKALQLGVNLMMQSYPQQRLAKECPNTTYFVQVLQQLSVLATEVGQMVRDLSSHSLSLLHDTDYDLKNNRVTLKVSSLKAWTKFNLTIPVSEIRFPVTTLPWELHTLIGNVSETVIQELMENLQPGYTYMKSFILAILNFVNTKVS